LDIVANLIDLPDDARRPRQQKAASFRQHHAAAVAGKEFGPQFMLEKFDLTTERGLCYPQCVGGFAEASELGHATERPQLTEIHTCQCWNAG
jgi:hypothetical protein